MSAAAQLKEMVEGLVDALTGETRHRLEELEARVRVLEEKAPAPTAKAAPARTVSAKAKAPESKASS
jgi:BMFP domain-containing protein YqiC